MQLGRVVNMLLITKKTSYNKDSLNKIRIMKMILFSINHWEIFAII